MYSASTNDMPPADDGRGHPPMTVGHLAAFLGAPLLPARVSAGAAPADIADITITDMCDDSRHLRPGDVYVAIPGQRWHGIDFEDAAIDRGAVVVISDRPARVLPTIIVADPRACVGPAAAWLHGNPSRHLDVFGVTGTNGKTSCTHFMHAGVNACGGSSGLLSGARIEGPGCRLTPGRTTPEATVLQRTLATFRRHGATAAALEVSSHAVAQHRVDGVRFRAMAFTNLSPDHLDFHGSLANYFDTKADLFTSARTDTAVVNIDDEHGRRLASQTEVPTWTCSTTDPGADVWAGDITVGESHGARFVAHTPVGRVSVDLRVLGPHQVPNSLLALTTLASTGFDVDAVAHGLSSVPSIAGRCEPVHAGQPFRALVDYMHNPAGQRAILPYLRATTPGRLILVIGATGDRDPAKRSRLGEYAAAIADIVIVTDESPGSEDPAAIRAAVLAGARMADSAVVVEIPDRQAAFEYAGSFATAGDTVVAAGRGSDTRRHFGSREEMFDDHAELHGVLRRMSGRR